MPNPTRQEIIDAHEALETLCARVPGETPVYAMKSLILSALPPRPRPTMADVEWDDDEHYLAEAVATPSDDKIIMLWESPSGYISIIRNGLVGAVSPDTLTPTGKRYTLTEVQE